MTVVDCHAHIYPENIAERASQSVGDFYVYPMYASNATADTLLALCEGSPITHHIVHSVAQKASNVEHINDFIAEECRKHPEFIGFATMHQDYPDPAHELLRCKALGLEGIKLHPDSQKVDMDDPRLMAVYEIAEHEHLPIIMHTGDYRYDYSHPRRLKKILHTFPDLVVDAAHFGGWSIFDVAVEFLEEERCFLDMSSSQTFIGMRRTEELVRLYGTSRIMFGSDYPMWNPVDEYESFVSLPFSEDEKEEMLWHNAEHFLGRKIS